MINSSACGVLQTARRYPDQIVKVYAGHSGILGALAKDWIDTSLEWELAIVALKHTPAAAVDGLRRSLPPALTRPTGGVAQEPRGSETFNARRDRSLSGGPTDNR